MKDTGNGPTKQRLLDAAAELISASPHQDVPIRAICERAGVQLPTLYHHFGSKDGLMDALVSFAFERYLSAKSGQPALADPIEVLRRGWDNHVEFGLKNPQLYALMYGRAHPGGRPTAAHQVEQLLLARTQEAFDAGRLAVLPELAAAQILSTNIGVTLSLITEANPEPDMTVSESIRDLLLRAISLPVPVGQQGSEMEQAGVRAVLAEPGLVGLGLVEPGLAELGLVEPGLVGLGLVEPGLVEPGLGEPVLAKLAESLATALDATPAEQVPLHPSESALLRHWLGLLG